MNERLRYRIPKCFAELRDANGKTVYKGNIHSPTLQKILRLLRDNEELGGFTISNVENP